MSVIQRSYLLVPELLFGFDRQAHAVGIVVA